MKNKESNMEVVKRNALEILAELHRKHEGTGECGIYDITQDGKLGNKLYDIPLN